MSLLNPFPEDFLHYVWRTLNFRLDDLQTTEGKNIQIIHPGTWNHNQGPDFLEAHLLIGGIEWHGHVEIHIYSEDWYHHKHHLDKLYNNTILHVAWQSSEGTPVREDGTAMPELVLKPYIYPNVHEKYTQLRIGDTRIPCESLVGGVKASTISSWVEEVAIERVKEKAEGISQGFVGDVPDWEQGLWEALMGIMGGPVNKELFRELAQRIPFHLVKKHAPYPIQIEALLYGGSGMLSGVSSPEPYIQELQKEWKFLSSKYKTPDAYPLPFKLMRMRPAAFPTLRISQVAAMIHLFPNIIQLLSAEGHKQLFRTEILPHSFWESHYLFDKEAVKKKKALGKSQKELIIINVLIPLAYLYYRYHGREGLENEIQNQLERIKGERNKITSLYTELGFPNENALNSQGLIQLKKKYCDEHHCLSCKIGHEILR